MSDAFKSELDKLLFCTLSLDGEARATHLGITREMYSERELADAWHNEKLALLDVGRTDPERNPVPLIKARAKLDEIHHRMIRR